MPLMEEKIIELSCMKKYPNSISYRGNLKLLEKTKISIVGTRKPSKYTREFTKNLATALSDNDICIVSGGAMGVDAIAHLGATSFNTIAVLPCGIDIKYPSVNTNLLQDIQENGLLLSQFDEGFKSRPWTFVTRNEFVVALGEILIVTESDINSGSMRSVEYALQMKKKIFVLPQRLGESRATNELLASGRAEAIYDIDAFVSRFSKKKSEVFKNNDPFLEYCKSNPSYDEALNKYAHKVFEAELNGDIDIVNAKIVLR